MREGWLKLSIPKAWPNGQLEVQTVGGMPPKKADAKAKAKAKAKGQAKSKAFSMHELKENRPGQHRNILTNLTHVDNEQYLSRCKGVAIAAADQNLMLG
eukprot:4398500-Amphidinium_carterae.1